MRALPILILLAITGCMGQIGGTTGGDDQPPTGSAKSIFVAKVYPILARCSGAGCHSTGATSPAMEHFYASDANTTYTDITAAVATIGDFNAIAPIITKIDAGHQTVSYSAADRSNILAWLAAEATARQGSGPPPADPVALMKTWSGCMTQANFDTAQMAQKFGANSASNGQACKNCHGQSAFGFTVSADSVPYFTAISTSMSQLLKYFTVEQGAVVINMAAMTNAGKSVPGHPPFDPTMLSGMPALQAFYTATKTAATAGGCAPPTAINP